MPIEESLSAYHLVEWFTRGVHRVPGEWSRIVGPPLMTFDKEVHQFFLLTMNFCSDKLWRNGREYCQPIFHYSLYLGPSESSLPPRTRHLHCRHKGLPQRSDSGAKVSDELVPVLLLIPLLIFPTFLDFNKLIRFFQLKWNICGRRLASLVDGGDWSGASCQCTQSIVYGNIQHQQSTGNHIRSLPFSSRALDRPFVLII